MSVYTEEGDVTNEDILIWKKVPVSSGFAVSKWRRKWLTLPEFLPGGFHGQRSLVGRGLLGCREGDSTERWSRRS